MSAVIIAQAHCTGRECGWTAGPGGWAAVDRQAERHTKSGHPTAIVAAPAAKTTAAVLVAAATPAKE